MQSPPSSGSDHANMPSPHLTPVDYPTMPLQGMAKKVTCPVCATTFAPQDTKGTCPVCGEQVVRHFSAGGDIPIISPALEWVRKGGNWKIAALAALVLYQVIMLIVLWIHMAQVHAL